jgi:hypothetical protein
MQPGNFPPKRFINYHNKISFGLTVILIGYVMSLVLIITPNDNLCKSVTNSTQQTAKLVGFEVQFISERFCQCFESKGEEWHVMPYISVGLFGGVVFLFVWLTYVYKISIKADRVGVEANDTCSPCKQFEIIAEYVNVEFVTILALLTWIFYFLLVRFTHRKLETNERSATHNEHMHFLSTGMFFLCYIVLWFTVITQHLLVHTHFKGLLRSVDFILWLTLVICALVFGTSGINWLNNNKDDGHELAIIMEYIIFCVLVAQVGMCIAFTWVYWREHEDGGNVIKKDVMTEPLINPLTDSPGVMESHVKYVTLNVDILGRA